MFFTLIKVKVKAILCYPRSTWSCGVLGIALLIFMSSGVALGQGYACLPDGFTNRSLASANASVGSATVAAVTALSGMKAHCRRGKLVDARGRDIRLYQIQGCWGNPPVDYQEILADQDTKIRRLSRRYTVLQIACQGDLKTVKQVN